MTRDDDAALIALEGALNFRDLGGYATEDGRRVVPGQLYRSDGLAGLTEADVERLRSLGLRTVVDLRRSDERTNAPTVVWDHEVEFLHLGVEPAGDELLDLFGALVDGKLGANPVGEMLEMYVDILDKFAERFRVLFDHAALDERRPLVFHCTAGKDRTGIVAMLLLGALGVPRDSIEHDYGLTRRFRTEKRMEVLGPMLDEAGVSREVGLVYLGAEPEVMARTIDHLDDTYGGIVPFLTDQVGVPKETLEQLRSALLT